MLQVLTTGSWPTQTAEMPDFPRECVAELDRFKQFYLGTHSGRKLTWQSNMGSAGGCGLQHWAHAQAAGSAQHLAVQGIVQPHR